MTDPLTITALSAVALTEGVKFLYTQAGEVLRRRRERREAAASAASPTEEALPAPAEASKILVGKLDPLVIDDDAVGRVEPALRQLRRDLQEYAEGIEPIVPGDQRVLEFVEALRGLLEAVYHQRITFEGERRAPSGPIVTGRVDVDEVAGYAAAVRARHVAGGRLEGAARAERVDRDAELIGVDLEGDQRS